MGSYKQKGFTIIELVLFLGITGALFAALMIGVNTNIYQQRYKDSVIAYKTLLEQQYADVAYPRNERNDKWTCNNETGVQPEPNGGEARGTSNCVLLGRYIQVKSNGTQAEVGSVIGIQPADTSGLTGDLAVLAAYSPRRSPIDKTDYSLAWDAALQTIDHQSSSASFLILRSPASGLVRTFALEEPLPSSLRDALTDARATAKVKNCVVPNGNVGLPTQSITVNANIGSANGIVLNGNDEQC